MRLRITDIETTRYRTSHVKDRLGNRQKVRTPYAARRPVVVVEGGRRFAHFFIDLLIFCTLFTLVEYILPFSTPEPNSIAAALFWNFFPDSIGYFFYYLTFENLTQSTPGKMLTKAVVINEYGEKPSFNELVVRNLIRIIPFEPLSCLSPRGWHDEWSKTWVVSKDERLLLLEKVKEKVDLDQNQGH